MRPTPEQLTTVPLLASLNPEQLAAIASLTELRSEPMGTRLVGEGAPGFVLFILLEGKADVTSRGAGLGTLGAGDFFGEIALLRDVPRTATARAATDVELLALEPEDFVAAVTGHAPSREAADAVIATRIGPLVPV